jgi:hypothetical protein
MMAFVYIPRWVAVSHLTGETPMRVRRVEFRGYVFTVTEFPP